MLSTCVHFVIFKKEEFHQRADCSHGHAPFLAVELPVCLSYFWPDDQILKTIKHHPWPFHFFPSNERLSMFNEIAICSYNSVFGLNVLIKQELQSVF